MLNQQYLQIVLDLDGTLLAAYSPPIYDSHIKNLKHKLVNQGVQHQLAQRIKQYEDDFTILKQYMESDKVEIGGAVYEARSETMPALPGRSQVLRSVIRLHDQGIIL